MADKPKHSLMVIMGAAPPPPGGRGAMPPKFGAPKKDAAPAIDSRPATPTPGDEQEGDQDCDDCAAFLADTSRCLIHGPDDQISPEGWCQHWRSNLGPFGATTKEQSGYQEGNANANEEADGQQGEAQEPPEAAQA